ncbi:unnamed protein product [Protopolystoma xenopodis]|uniref:Uncharacterized protein n=1 Tax=Protopolystoma xenopodis TaxID=117903 RepID=A0A3S5FG51_9PLAT|nr:unnamed protein product [Protopolystoma xenopodis]
MAKLTDDADYDSGETSGNVPRIRSDFGKYHAYNGLRTMSVPQSVTTNMTKLRKQGLTISIQHPVEIGHVRFLLFLSSSYPTGFNML